MPSTMETDEGGGRGNQTVIIHVHDVFPIIFNPGPFFLHNFYLDYEAAGRIFSLRPTLRLATTVGHTKIQTLILHPRLEGVDQCVCT